MAGVGGKEWFGGEGLSRGQKGEKEESWEQRMGEKKERRQAASRRMECWASSDTDTGNQ